MKKHPLPMIIICGDISSLIATDNMSKQSKFLKILVVANQMHFSTEVLILIVLYLLILVYTSYSSIVKLSKLSLELLPYVAGDKSSSNAPSVSSKIVAPKACDIASLRGDKRAKVRGRDM
jgi:hypothetical protein